MPDSQMFHGVLKSGSPTPKEITSFIVRARSKNFRIPEGGICRVLSEIKFRIQPPLERVRKTLSFLLFKKRVAIFLIGFHDNVCRRFTDAIHWCNMLRDKTGNFLHVLSAHLNL